MTKPPVLTNRKPADELAWLREQIRDLKGREDYIRRMILAGKMDAEGDDFDALPSITVQNRFDRKAAEAELGDLSRFNTKVEVTQLRVKAKASVAEVIEDEGW